jgi:hypothetical protein
VAYLSQAEQIVGSGPWKPSLEGEHGLPSIPSLVVALQWLAAKQITTVAQQLQVTNQNNPFKNILKMNNYEILIIFNFCEHRLMWLRARTSRTRGTKTSWRSSPARGVPPNVSLL